MPIVFLAIFNPELQAIIKTGISKMPWGKIAIKNREVGKESFKKKKRAPKTAPFKNKTKMGKMPKKKEKSKIKKSKKELLKTTKRNC